MSGTNWTGKAGDGNWFNANNWSGGVPTVSSTSIENVTIASVTSVPTLTPLNAPNTVILEQSGAGYEDYQIDGMAITIANNASLVMQGIAIGRFHGTGGDTANGGTITNLTPAASSTPLYDTQMTISAGGASTLQFNDVNHNFGEFYAESGDTLSVLTSQGGNVQTAHALYNYGLIEAGAGGNVEISVANATTSGDTVNFYNDGWLMANGGTLSTNSGILDGANTANPAGTADGYIEIMNKGVANLLGSVAAKEEVIFAGTVTGNTLIVDATNGFAGTVAGFSPGNTIAVAGFSGTANLTTAVSGGDTVLSTKIGSVTDNITLVGTSNPFFDVSTVTVGSITSEVINTDAANYTYAPTGGSTDGYNGANYVGGAAPGSTIHAGENITIASGTAQFGGTPDSPANGTLTDNGTIDVTGSGSVAGTLIAAEPIAGNGSIFIDHGAQVTLSNATGNDGSLTVDFGTNGSSLALNQLVVNGSTAGFGGTIAGFGLNDDVVLGHNVLPSLASTGHVSLGLAGSILTVAELNSAGSVTGTTTLDVGAGQSLANFGALIGTNGINIETPATAAEGTYTFTGTGTTTSFYDPSNYPGGIAPGSTIVPNEVITIASGTASISSTAPLTDNGTIDVVGTASSLTDASPIAGNGSIFIDHGAQVTLSNATGNDGSLTVDFGTNGSSLALNQLVVNGSTAGFGGTIAGFGLNDDVVLGHNVLPSLASSGQVSLSLAGSILTVAELNSAGSVTGTTTLDVGAGQSLANFVALIGTNGINIETPATAAEGTYTFTGTGTTTSFYDPSNYPGGIAPGSTIVPNEVITIASGTASISSTAPLTDNGTIDVVGTASSLTDASPIAGNGSIFIDHGAQVTLSNATGNDGSLIVDFGTNGSSLALNQLVVNGSTAGFGGTIAGFGLNDDVVLGHNVLPSLASTGHVSLGLAGSILTVAELNSAGSVTGTTTLDVGAGQSLANFVALIGTNGINIETPATVKEQSFTLQSTGGSSAPLANFEDPTQYKAGLAPGSTIVAGETVTVLQPTLADLTSPLDNNGVINLSGFNANFETTSPLTGNGTVDLTGGSVVILDNATGTTTNTISFGTGANTLQLDGSPSGFDGPITGFNNPNDQIDLGGAVLPTPSSASNVALNYNSSTGILTASDTVSGTVSTEHLTFAVGSVPGQFSASLGPNGIVIQDVPCYAAGTKILTMRGHVAVENMVVGDQVVIGRPGSMKATRPVTWIGNRRIDLVRHANREKVQPVRILAGALGDGLPERDLVVSPDHALYLQGVLIEAKTLINGATIIRDRASSVTYYHIELDQHDIMLAEGVAAESYLDTGNRAMFANHASVVQLHADFARLTITGHCAPLLHAGETVTAIRAALLARATTLGFTTSNALALTLSIDGECLTFTETTLGRLVAIIPAGAKTLGLHSAIGVPAELSADPSDRRALGVAISAMMIGSGAKFDQIDLATLTGSGLYAVESDHQGAYRWTNGNAAIDLPVSDKAQRIEILLRGAAKRWAVGLRASA